MSKKARDFKKGEKIKIAGKTFFVENVEVSDVGKQGVRKVRLELKSESGEKIIIIRPDDYPFEGD